jgi:hypothetical protein
MIEPFDVFKRAFKLWWDEWFVLTVLHIGWFLAQFLIVTGPPATAVLYSMVRRSLDGDYWDHREVGEALRQLFWPAWRWAGLNLLVGGMVLFNLLVYQDNDGGIWPVLRAVWIVALVLWGSLNLFYWPFWLAQSDKSMRTTYANCGRFLLLNIWQAPLIVFICAVLAVVSVLTTLPFTLARFVWLALLAETAVQQSMSAISPEPG